MFHWLKRTKALSYASIAGLLGFCLGGCKDRSPIYIGYVASLSGRESDIARDCRNGVELAIDECNLAGGLLGRHVQLVVRDDGADPKKAVQADKELVQAGCTVIIGHITSSMCEPAIPYINSTKSVLISPTSTSQLFVGKNDRFYRLYQSSGKIARVQAHYLYNHLKLRRMVVAYAIGNRAHSQVWSEIVASEFKRLGGQVVEIIPFDSVKMPSYRRIAQSISAKKPDCVVVLGNVLDNAMICQHLRSLGCQAVCSGSEWSITQEFRGLAGKAVEGFLIAGSYEYASMEPSYKHFVESYKQRYGRHPSLLAMHAYDAARLGLSGIRNAIKEGKDVKQALDEIREFAGTQGSIHLDEYGDIQGTARISVVRGSEFVAVYKE